MGMAHIIVEVGLQEYYTNYRPIRQRPKAPSQKGSRGQALVRSWIFGGKSLSAWLILLLKCTLSNIMCIMDPLDRRHTPSIESVLEGRHFFALGFSGAGTVGIAHIIIEMHYQEYYAYYRPIIQRPEAPSRKGSRGQALVRSWIFGGAVTIGVANIIVEMYSQQYYVYYRPIRRRPHTLNRKRSRGQALSCN